MAWDAKRDTDLTSTMRFLAAFFIVTVLLAAALIGGTIAFTVWVVNL